MIKRFGAFRRSGRKNLVLVGMTAFFPFWWVSQLKSDSPWDSTFLLRKRVKQIFKKINSTSDDFCLCHWSSLLVDAIGGRLWDKKHQYFDRRPTGSPYVAAVWFLDYLLQGISFISGFLELLFDAAFQQIEERKSLILILEISSRFVWRNSVRDKREKKYILACVIASTGNPKQNLAGALPSTPPPRNTFPKIFLQCRMFRLEWDFGPLLDY